jgi:prolyl-tRNA synthetase
MLTRNLSYKKITGKINYKERLFVKSKKTAITPTRKENYPEWFQQVIKNADLAENAPVRGCMVIKPNGYSLWENIQRVLDDMIKDTGHSNAYFPLLIPLSFIQKEASHVKGFAKECAVVTHHRLKQNENLQLVPDGKLEEPLIIRPTSETVIGYSFSRWINSYRDLPLLINQWANIVRWEMRPRLFLRTTEFLWQEGHTVHETAEEAQEETKKILSLYTSFAKEWMALPVVAGLKTPDEKFPGAVDTYTIEAMVQDKKAIQAGTSHFLGQNFSKASEIKFLDANGKEQYGWTTSWGVTTRLIGTLIMAHSDDNGLVIPPKIATKHVLLLPFYRNKEEQEEILKYCEQIKNKLANIHYGVRKLLVHIDKRDIRGGAKYWQHIKQGAPIIIEIGKRELENSTLTITRRDHGPEKKVITQNDFIDKITSILDSIQTNIYEKALALLNNNIKPIETLDEFQKFFQQKNPGFALCHWHKKAIGHPILEKLKVTPRCIPLDDFNGLIKKENGICIFSKEETTTQVIFAHSY